MSRVYFSEVDEGVYKRCIQRSGELVIIVPTLYQHTIPYPQDPALVKLLYKTYEPHSMQKCSFSTAAVKRCLRPTAKDDPRGSPVDPCT